MYTGVGFGFLIPGSLSNVLVKKEVDVKYFITGGVGCRPPIVMKTDGQSRTSI